MQDSCWLGASPQGDFQAGYFFLLIGRISLGKVVLLVLCQAISLLVKEHEAECLLCLYY